MRQRLSRLAPETAATARARRRRRAAVRAASARRGRRARPGRPRRRRSRRRFASGIVEELPEPAPACRFTHELVRRAVYDRVTGIRRAELHLRVGEALERVHAADPARVLPELAHHFTLAAPVAGAERAVDYNLRAADAAIAAAAYDEAAARLSTALELGIADPRERARVQVELAYLLSETGRVSEADAILAASLDAATGLEERGIAARALVQRLGSADWRIRSSIPSRCGRIARGGDRDLRRSSATRAASPWPGGGSGMALDAPGPHGRGLRRRSNARSCMRTPPATRRRAGR